MPDRQLITFQNFYSAWVENTASKNIPGATGIWTPVSSSVSFTASSKLSRGGFGNFNSFQFIEGIVSGNVVGNNSNKTISDTTDELRFLENFINFHSVIESETFFSIITDGLEGGSVWDSTSSFWSGAGFIWGTLDWIPVSSSVSFTASSKLSRGGFGLLNALKISGSTVKSGSWGANQIESGTLYVNGGGEIRNGSATITCTIQVGAGVLVDGAANLSATGTMTAILSKEETGTPGTILGSGTLTCSAVTIPLEAGMIGGVIVDNRSIEAPETIAGTQTAESISAQFSDFYSGYYNRSLMWGFTENPNGNFNQRRLTSVTGNDWLRVPLVVFSVSEEDVTPDVTTLSGITGRTTDLFSGTISEQFGTIDNITHAFLTQATTEVLAQVDSNARLTQAAVELLFSPGSSALLTQTAVEVLRKINVGWIQQEAVESLGNQISALRYAVLQQTAVEVMYSIKAKVNFSQLAHEVLKGANPDPPVNLSSVAHEVLRQRTEIDTTPSLVQQVALESLRNAVNPPASINHAALEWIIQPIPFGVINHAALEWIRSSTSIPAWVNHDSMEVVRDADITPAITNHIAIELLVRTEFDPTVSSLINNPKYLY